MPNMVMAMTASPLIRIISNAAEEGSRSDEDAAFKCAFRLPVKHIFKQLVAVAVRSQVADVGIIVDVHLV